MDSDPSVRAARVKLERELLLFFVFMGEIKIGLTLTFDLAESLVGESVEEEIEKVCKEIKIKKNQRVHSNIETIMRKDEEHRALCKKR